MGIGGDTIKMEIFNQPDLQYKEYKLNDVNTNTNTNKDEVNDEKDNVSSDTDIINSSDTDIIVDIDNNNNTNFEDVIIPKGFIYLIGDNRNNSTDSRTYGPIPESLLIGKVILKVYPTISFIK